MGGFCPGGILSGGILSGGYCPGGYCPGGYCPRTEIMHIVHIQCHWNYIEL